MSDVVLIHIGTGESRQTYEWSASRLSNLQAIAIEQATGLTVTGLLRGLANNSAMALTAAIWTCRKREGEPNLAFRDVRFNLSEIELEDPDSVDETSDGSEPLSEDEGDPKPVELS